MTILDKSLAEVERKCQFGCDKNYSDEEMVKKTIEYKKQIPITRIKYYIKKLLSFIKKIQIRKHFSSVLRS